MSELFPLVSIITPAKNRAALLRETICSVLVQSYPNWEMLIIDDASTDNTVDMLKEFSSEKRIIYQQRKGETGGAQVCRNQGIEMANGKYLILLDSDDLLTETCLEKRVKYIKEHNDLDFAVFPTIIFGWEYPDYDTYWNLPNGKDEISRFLNWDPLWQTASVIWKKTSLQSVSPFNENTLSFQDIEIHIKALLIGLKHQFVSTDTDNFHREHEGERIGHHTHNTEHLYSHERLLHTFYQQLNEKEMLTRQRKTSLAGFYFRVCNFWIQQNNLEKAKELWHQVSEMKLTSNFTYFTALLYFNYLSLNKKEDIPLISRLRYVFYKLLPPDFFLFNNTWKKLKKR